MKRQNGKDVDFVFQAQFLLNEKGFQSIEEPLEENSQDSENILQSNKAEYISTNLLFKANMNVSDIQVETIEYSKIEEKFKASFLMCQSINFKQEIIDPKNEVKESKKRGCLDSLLKQEEIDFLAKIAFEKNMEFNKQKLQQKNIPQEQSIVNVNILQKKVDNMHNRVFTNEEKQSLYIQNKKFYDMIYLKGKYKLNKNKQNEKLYLKAWQLRKNYHLSVQEISQKLKISRYMIKKIDTCESQDELKFLQVQKKRKRFKVIHERARILISKYIQQATTLVQVNDIVKYLKQMNSINLSASTIRNYLKEEL